MTLLWGPRTSCRPCSRRRTRRVHCRRQSSPAGRLPCGAPSRRSPCSTQNFPSLDLRSRTMFLPSTYPSVRKLLHIGSGTGEIGSGPVISEKGVLSAHRSGLLHRSSERDCAGTSRPTGSVPHYPTRGGCSVAQRRRPVSVRPSVPQQPVLLVRRHARAVGGNVAHDTCSHGPAMTTTKEFRRMWIRADAAYSQQAPR